MTKSFDKYTQDLPEYLRQLRAAKAIQQLEDNSTLDATYHPLDNPKEWCVTCMRACRRVQAVDSYAPLLLAQAQFSLLFVRVS